MSRKLATDRHNLIRRKYPVLLLFNQDTRGEWFAFQPIRLLGVIGPRWAIVLLADG